MLLSSLTSNTLSVPSELGSSLLSGGSESSLLPATIFSLWDSTAARFCSSRSRLYSSASRWRMSWQLRSKFSVVLICFCRFPPLFFVFFIFNVPSASVVAVFYKCSVCLINPLERQRDAVDVLQNSSWCWQNSSEVRIDKTAVGKLILFAVEPENFNGWFLGRVLVTTTWSS